LNIVTEGLELVSAVKVKVADTSYIEADLILPPDPLGIVIIAHGQNSSRLSPRNRFVASLLRERGLGTFLFDTETPDEASSLDVCQMASRILLVSEWLRERFPELGRAIGYMGAGTGSAAALFAAAQRPELVHAIVCRGGRVELAHAVWEEIRTPTLLIVGAKDSEVADSNWKAVDRFGATQKRLEIIPGARHLFDEPGALAAVAMHAGSWFARHLAPGGPEMVDETRIWRTAVTVSVDR
jgi:hypothetical protein